MSCSDSLWADKLNDLSVLIYRFVYTLLLGIMILMRREILRCAISGTISRSTTAPTERDYCQCPAILIPAADESESPDQLAHPCKVI